MPTEEEIYEILAKYKEVIMQLSDKCDALEADSAEKIKHLEERVADLEHQLYDNILNPTIDVFDKEAKDLRYTEFLERNGEKLGPYADQAKALSGKEDFDYTKEAFEGFENREDKNMSEEDYINTLLEKTVSQIEAVREAFGAEKVTAEVTDDGVKVEADGEDITEEVTDKIDAPEGEAKEEEKTEETTPTEEAVEEVSEEIEDSPEEIEALVKELEKYK